MIYIHKNTGKELVLLRGNNKVGTFIEINEDKQPIQVYSRYQDKFIPIKRICKMSSVELCHE